LTSSFFLRVLSVVLFKVSGIASTVNVLFVNSVTVRQAPLTAILSPGCIFSRTLPAVIVILLCDIALTMPIS
jgi:hypothetical protein